MENTNSTPEVADIELLTPTVETSPDPAPAPAPKPRKRKQKQEVRNLAELNTASTRSMNDTEKNKYIEALRTIVEDLTVQNTQLDLNCKTAYEKCRVLEQRFANYKNVARAKLQFAKQAISTCHNSIILAGNIEEE